MKYLILPLMTALIVSCQNTSTGPQNAGVPSMEEVSRVSINQSGYDMLTVQSNDDFILPDSNMIMVQIGYYRQDTLHLICEQVPQFTDINGRQRVQFKMIFSVDASTLYFPLTVRYLFKGCNQLEIDSTMVMCRYPYVNSYVVLRWSDISDEKYTYVNDFDMRGDYLYYLNRFSNKIYEYRLSDGSNREIVSLAGANYMSSDSDYIFITDGDLYTIYRFDLKNDSLNNIVSFNYKHFGGIVARNKRLFVDQRESRLYEYDYSGTLLETFPDVLTGETLALQENTLYSAYPYQYITRYDLNAGIRLDSRPLPTMHTDAVKIVNGYLYFSDHTKDFLGRVPLADVDGFSESMYANGAHK